MKTMILMALLALMFLIIASEGKTVPQPTTITWSPEIPSRLTRMVNLTNEAENFIKTIVRGRGKLTTLNFKGGFRPLKERSVDAVVNPLIYGDTCDYTADIKKPNCKDIYTWDINEGIVSPLSLPVNVTVRRRRQNWNVTLDLNGASSITWSLRKENPTKMKLPETSLKQKCNFTAETSFEGYIAYRLKERRGDTPEYDAFDIVQLADQSKGLEKRKNTLLYNVTGTFRHYRMCKDRKVIKPTKN
uniref:Putative da-p36 protein n=1 Tax=Rhipicephalus pulchellus TaxID=72859 RepID=L7LRZ9_RHIPC